MNAIVDHHKDVQDFVRSADVLPFVKRVNVCINSGKKMLEYSDGTTDEYVDRKKDAGQ